MPDMTLTREDEKKLIRAIETWAEHHPHPDAAVVHWGAAGKLSPRQIAKEIGRASETGRQLIEVFQNGLRRTTIDKMVEQLSRRSQEQASTRTA